MNIYVNMLSTILISILILMGSLVHSQCIAQYKTYEWNVLFKSWL